MVVELSQQDLKDLKRQGFSEQEIAKAVHELENEELQESAMTNTTNPRYKAQTSAFSSAAIAKVRSLSFIACSGTESKSVCHSGCSIWIG